MHYNKFNKSNLIVLRLRLYLPTAAATEARSVICNQSETRMLVSNWLQLTGLIGLRLKLTSINVGLKVIINRAFTYLFSTLVYNRVYIPLPGPPALNEPPPPIIILITQQATKSSCWWLVDSNPITTCANSGSDADPEVTSERSISSYRKQIFLFQLFENLTDAILQSYLLLAPRRW